MAIPVRQSTAFELSVGPVLDADGVAVTGCVVGDFKIKKTTGNFAALNGSATLTHVSAGTYDLVLTTSDTDTVGLLTVAIDDTVNACASVRLQVMEEVIYDALYAASAPGYLQPTTSGRTLAVDASGNANANVTQFGGSNGTFSGGRPEVNATHLAGSSTTLSQLIAASLAYAGTASSGSTTTLVDAGLTQVDDYWIGSWVLFTSGNNIGQARLITDFVAGTDTVTFSPAVANSVTTHSYVIIPAAGLLAPQTGDSYAIVNHGTNGNAAIKTQVAAIETDTQDIQSRIPAALVNSRMDCTIDGTGMESGAVAAIRDEMDNNSAKLASILEDTAELQMDWVNGGRLDLIIDNVNTLVTGNDAYLSDLDSRIPAALTGDGNMKADALRINGQLTSAAATVTFPATLASTTNITAGTITTVTNLTNAPTSGDLTSTMKDSVETAVTTALGGTDVTDFTAIPSGTPNVLEALGFLYAQGFYRKEQTATTTTLFDGDNVAVAEATTSDDGTTFVRTKFTAP